MKFSTDFLRRYSSDVKLSPRRPLLLGRVLHSPKSLRATESTPVAQPSIMFGRCQSITSVSHWCFSVSWKLVQSISSNLSKFVSVGGHGLFGLILTAPLVYACRVYYLEPTRWQCNIWRSGKLWLAVVGQRSMRIRNMTFLNSFTHFNWNTATTSNNFQVSQPVYKVW